MDMNKVIAEIKKTLDWWEQGLINKVEFRSRILEAISSPEELSCQNKSLIASSGVYVVEQKYGGLTEEDFELAINIVSEVRRSSTPSSNQ